MSDGNTIALSVRQLVEYVYLSGSIDPRAQSVEALQEGTKAHQRVQESYGEQDRKELYLKADIACDDLLFVVDGRCDGLLATEPAPTVDEIKSTRGELARLEATEGRPVHWAQALFYAYMYAAADPEAVPTMRMQLTYVHKDTGETLRFVRELAYAELAAEVRRMLLAYAPYARLRLRHERERDASIGLLPFPFESYRAGQRKLAGAVYKTVEEKASLFAKAPTGIGKTVSVLFPAVKAIGSGLLRRIFYLTARTTTRTAAEDALKLMRDKGLHAHAVTLTAKEKICFQEETRCDKELCPYANGYYDRINGAMLDLLAHETIMTRDVIEAYARKHRVCPFEMSLDAAYVSDIVICDYNYIFDPRISLKRQYGEMKRGSVLLVDEAHNLVERARDMYSAELSKAPFLALQRELKGRHAGAWRAAKAINDYFIALRKRMAEREGPLVESEAPKALVELVGQFAEQAEALLAAEASATGGADTLLEAYYAAGQWLRSAKLYDERFVTYAETERGDVRIKLFCLDPSKLLGEAGKGYRARVYFSATLSPLRFYMDMLGGGELDYSLSLPSPFSGDQLRVKMLPLSTRYQDRADSCVPIAQAIARTVSERRGNYFVFFPSYAYMKAVYDAYISLAEYDGGTIAGRDDSQSPDAVEAPDGAASREAAMRPEVRLQRSDMTEEERDEFLAAFRPDGQSSRIGFAVLGGVFSEGVDLPGERLIGVIVVGVGLPQLGLERNLLRDYYQRQGKSGYDYAYVIPGMNKVLQAGGRLIRSERDSGSLTLIDDRYLQPGYRRLLPPEWLEGLRDEGAEGLNVQR